MIFKKFDETKLKNAKTIEEKKGFKNEKDAAYIIDFEFMKSETTAVLHDVRFEYKGRIAQIDHLLISPYFVTVIESKFFSGKVKIDENNSWTVKYGEKIIPIPSPILQNERHVLVLKEILNNENIIPKGKKIPEIINCVMLSNKVNFEGKLPPEVFFADNIKNYLLLKKEEIIKQHPLKMFGSFFVSFNEKELIEVCNNLIKFNTIKNEEESQSFISLFKSFYAENKEEKEKISFNEDKKRQLLSYLKKVRLTLANKENKPVYQIFSDKTLEEIVEKKPKNKDEFIGISGVGEFKYEKYGENFIKAIVNFK